MDNIITKNLRGFEIKFKTKPGVFSKQGVDSGTRLLVDYVKIKNGTMIADLGCGTGVIGLVAAKLNPSGHVHLLDDHLRVVDLAKENAQLNELTNVEVYLSDLFSAVADHSYHQIFSNPPQHLGNDFLEEVAKECGHHLKPAGQLIWVIQKHVKPVIERLFKKYLGNCKILAHGREHVVLSATKHI